MNLRRQGVAVSRRTTFNHIGDIHLAAVEIDRSQQIIQVLARRPDKRASLLVFMPARPFADEEYIGILGSLTGDSPGPGLLSLAETG